jgi:hypothetical protein
VLVGDALPDEASGLAAPLISVMPYRGGASVRIAALETPAMSPLDTRIPVDAKVLVAGARGRRLSVELVDGDVVVDRRSEVVDSDSALRTVTLAYVPAVAGSTLLRVRARIEKTPLADSATTVVDATEDRFEVLFFYPRASWLSTFVRRGVERDPRFAVMHRVVTSRGVSNTGGAAPVALRDAQALSQYATIVIGAPEQLTEADVAGLDAFCAAARWASGPAHGAPSRGAGRSVDGRERLAGGSPSDSDITRPDSRFPIPDSRPARSGNRMAGDSARRRISSLGEHWPRRYAQGRRVEHPGWSRAPPGEWCTRRVALPGRRQWIRRLLDERDRGVGRRCAAAGRSFGVETIARARSGDADQRVDSRRRAVASQRAVGGSIQFPHRKGHNHRCAWPGTSPGTFSGW